MEYGIPLLLLLVQDAIWKYTGAAMGSANRGKRFHGAVTAARKSFEF